MQSTQFIPLLQAAVSPVVLISGVGLLILSMTNRLARVVDRARQLGAVRRGAGAESHPNAGPQLTILVRRARLLRRAIGYSAVCVLLAAILVIVLFLSAYLQSDAVLPAVVLFILCLVSLIVALLSFIQDINLSLVALDLELDLPADKSG